MTISDVLLEGRLTFKSSRQGGRRVKILRFLGGCHLWMALSLSNATFSIVFFDFFVHKLNYIKNDFV